LDPDLQKKHINVWKEMPPELVPGTLIPSEPMLEHLRADLTVDLGGGAGDLLAKIIPDAKRALLIDCNRQLLLRARKQDAPTKIGLLNADISQCPLAADSADLVIMQALLTTIPARTSQERTAWEAARILKSGGLLYVSEFLINDHLEYYTQRYRLGTSGVFPVHDPRGRWLYDAKHWRIDELLNLFSANFSVRIINERTVQTRSGNRVKGVELIMSRN
jgi:ubiquinone/menaquinone biosynthesis C-methylase UbiE